MLDRGNSTMQDFDIASPLLFQWTNADDNINSTGIDNKNQHHHAGISEATKQLKKADACVNDATMLIIATESLGLNNGVTWINDDKNRIMNEWPWRSLLPSTSVSTAKLNFNQSADLMEPTCVGCLSSSANVSSRMLNKLKISTSPNITLEEGDGDSDSDGTSIAICKKLNATGETTQQRTVSIVDRSSGNIQGRDRDGLSQSNTSTQKSQISGSTSNTPKLLVAGELVDLPVDDVGRLFPWEKTIDTNTTTNDVRSLLVSAQENLVSPTFVPSDIDSTNTSTHQGLPLHTSSNTLASTTATTNTKLGVFCGDVDEYIPISNVIVGSIKIMTMLSALLMMLTLCVYNQFHNVVKLNDKSLTGVVVTAALSKARGLNESTLSFF